LPAIIVLGIIVSLVELPCTGGIYLGILSLIADGGSKGIWYLVVYNLIFVLPLVLISYMIYHGTRVERVNAWVQENKRYMRLAAGLIMVFLALVLLGIL
jgi:cytochrome c biogenesis protein CcdA